MNPQEASTSPDTTHGRRALPTDAAFPVVGALPYLVRDRLDHLVDARNKLGDVYLLDIGVSRVIALNHPEHAQHILRDNVANYTKGNAIWESIRTLLGNGLPVSTGDFWRRQRRLVQPQFHRERLEAMASQMVDAIDETMQGWDDIVSSGAPIDIAAQLSRMTMRVIVKTMFGSTLDQRDADLVTSQFGYVNDFMLFGVVTQKLPSWLPVPGRRRYAEAIARIDEVVFRAIERHDDERGGSLIKILLDRVDDETGARMTPKELRDEAVAMFLAGYETTAVALAFAFHAMSEHHDIARALDDEILSVVGERRPTFADLPRLPLALAVTQEALRLYPPAYWVPRVAVHDDEIDGFHIPAGAEVGVMTYVIHRHPDFWKDPTRFDPGRFKPELAGSRHPLAWLPFGAGQRICVGKDFALMEAQLILARVLSRYRLDPVPGRAARVHVGTALRPAGGVWLRLRRRSASGT